MPRWRPVTRISAILVVAAALVGGALAWKSVRESARFESSRNYKLTYDKPDGWIEKSHTAQTLFLYQNPHGVQIKGGHMQIVDAENPTPELDRDGLSKSFAAITRDNLGWKATMGEVINFEGGSYRLIRREANDRTIVSAVSVRGNTTIIVTLAAIGKAQSHIDEAVPAFKTFLKGNKLTLTQYD